MGLFDGILGGLFGGGGSKQSSASGTANANSNNEVGIGISTPVTVSNDVTIDTQPIANALAALGIAYDQTASSTVGAINASTAASAAVAGALTSSTAAILNQGNTTAAAVLGSTGALLNQGNATAAAVLAGSQSTAAAIAKLVQADTQTQDSVQQSNRAQIAIGVAGLVVALIAAHIIKRW